MVHAAGFSSAGNAFMQVLVLSVSRDFVILCLYILVGHGNVMKPDTLTESEPEEGAMGQEMRDFKLGSVTRRARECTTHRRSRRSLLNSFSTFAVACCFL